MDRSNSSYYGSSGLFYLKIDINKKLSPPCVTCSDGMVPLSKQGQVHDVQWSPVGDKFVVIAGNMPAQATLFSANLDPIFEFGSAHRNTISWAPHGRFLCLAGFGNLAGEMDFYDVLRLRRLGSAVAHATVTHGWSPDSRFFLSATVAPRMNVDNGFKIFKHNGSGPLLPPTMYPQIFNVSWQPMDSKKFSNRGPSPPPASAGTNSSQGTNKSQNASGSVAGSAPYRPPAYRAPGLSGAFSELLKRDTGPVGKVKKDTNAGITALNTVKVVPQRAIPGMVVPAQNKQRLPKSSVKNSAVTTTATTMKSEPTAETLKSTDSKPANDGDSDPGSEKERKLKALRKKLKQIEDIKLKKSNGTTLNDDQLNKLASEPTLLRELQELSSNAS